MVSRYGRSGKYNLRGSKQARALRKLLRCLRFSLGNGYTHRRIGMAQDLRQKIPGRLLISLFGKQFVYPAQSCTISKDSSVYADTFTQK